MYPAITLATTTAIIATAAVPTTARSTIYEFEDYDYFGDFITSRYVKSYWSAFYALCLYWGCFWFARHIFGDGSYHMFNREEAVHNLESDRSGHNRRIRHLLWTNSSTAIDIFVSLLVRVCACVSLYIENVFVCLSDKIKSCL
jgi:hypothetical protein